MKKKHYHLIGIGGISMSGLAKLLKSQGATVTGSDISLGGHKKENITPDIDQVIVTKASIWPGAPAEVEINQAKKLGINIISRSEAIGSIMRDYEGIAVAGTHGKTTVTTLVGRLLEEMGEDPTVLVGGNVTNWNGTARVGKGRYFVVEACEYEKQFLDFPSKYAILTNVEAEHLDTYKDEADVIETFRVWLSKLSDAGFLVAWGDSENVSKVIAGQKKRIFTYGQRDKVDYRLSGILVSKTGTSFKLNEDRFETSLFGKTNALNAASAVVLALNLGFGKEKVAFALKRIQNAKRRQEVLGEASGVTVVDDYGHHPTEIKATLAALRERYPERRLVVVFEPHQINRTKNFLAEFSRVLAAADKVFILPVYLVPGRDNPEDEKLNLHQKIAQGVSSIVPVADYDQALTYLKKEIRPNDLVLTIGATSVFKIGLKLCQFLRENEHRSRSVV